MEGDDKEVEKKVTLHKVIDFLRGGIHDKASKTATSNDENAEEEHETVEPRQLVKPDRDPITGKMDGWNHSPPPLHCC